MVVTIRTDEIGEAISTYRDDHLGFSVLIGPDRFHAGRPIVIPASQRYYWTEEWQDGEAEALAELKRGEGREFESGRETVAWLHAEED